MLRVLHDDTKTSTRKVPALFCVAIIAAVAALLLLVFTINFQGLDRLLPDGGLFLPNYTT
jgi:hypothetical protein